MNHPEINIHEPLEKFHRRCADYHTARHAELIIDQNYRAAATHGDKATCHTQAAKFLASLTDAGPIVRDTNPDERNDAAIGR